MAIRKSTTCTAPAEPKNRPIITLTAQATDKWPTADPNPIPQLAMIAGDVKHMAEHLESLYDLSALNEDDPVIAGCSHFLCEIIKRLKEDVELLSDIGDSLTVVNE